MLCQFYGQLALKSHKVVRMLTFSQVALSQSRVNGAAFIVTWKTVILYLMSKKNLNSKQQKSFYKKYEKRPIGKKMPDESFKL